MQRIRGHLVATEMVALADGPLTMLRPVRGEALLDDPRVIERFEEDEYMPYWAQIWSAARVLAAEVAAWPPANPDRPETVLELGAGLGLVGLAAARRGYRVTLSDHDEDALAFARESALANGLAPPQTRVIDWRSPPLEPRVDRIVAADVLYETRHLEPVALCIQQQLALDGFALICDVHRRTADPFPQVAHRAGLQVAVRDVEVVDPGASHPSAGRLFEVRHA
jgi:predicted nicotinamide N-methyase